MPVQFFAREEYIFHRPSPLLSRNSTCRISDYASAAAIRLKNVFTFYNFSMADWIVSACVTCPKCGTWVVVEREISAGMRDGKFRAVCPAPECGKDFEFENLETRVFELPPAIFERRHFFRSELREA